VSVLQGVRVVDLTRYLSGPTLTMLLADYGADVIKVEKWPGGDPARESGPRAGTESVYYMASNRNKRSIALNMRSTEGLEICKRLISTADVLVENFRPGVAQKLGLGWTEVHAMNPRLVYCSINGFGSSGPGADVPGFDQTVQAMSGLMSVTGTPRTGPLRVGIAVADSVAGVFGAFGVAAALFKRDRTGVGLRVECSLMGSMLSLMSYQAQRYLSLQEMPGQDGNDHPLMFPQGTFKTGDGAITIASGNEQMWGRLCQALELGEFAEDERFVTNSERMENRVALRKLIEDRLRSGTSQHWMDVIQRSGVPCGPVLNMKEALEHPVTEALGMIGEVHHATIGHMRVLGRPVRMATDDSPDAEEWLRLAPPVCGQHSVEICTELGILKGELEVLIENGVVGIPEPI
jgi:crotonobetainyl-CoA:carnitine CoA-transferase CaiB-like acyl-CoA transferase